MVRSDFATKTGWQRFCPPSQRRGGRSRLSEREAQSAPPGGVCRQVLLWECLVRQSLFNHSLAVRQRSEGARPLQYDSVAKAQGHCLSNIAHFASARCTALLIRLPFPYQFIDRRWGDMIIEASEIIPSYEYWGCRPVWAFHHRIQLFDAPVLSRAGAEGM